MTRNMISFAAFVICCGEVGIASAVEPTQPIIPLFNEYLMTNTAGLDISEHAGIEAPGANESLDIIPGPSAGQVKSRLNFILKVKGSDNTNLGSFRPSVATMPYPDPSTAVGTSYSCEDDGVFRGANPNSEPFPCDYDVNVGIANFGATRYLVTSLALYAAYQNSTEGYVDISRAAVFVWDPVTHAESWHKAWAVTSGGWELVDGLCAVGDFLDSDGADEVRIAYSRDGANGKVVMKYDYYDISTGNEVPNSQQIFSVPSP